MKHLSQAWRMTRVGAIDARFQHFFLPEDPDEAHRALVHMTRTARRHHAATAGEYDHARLHDLVASEGFSHHPLHGAAPSTGYMASYNAPEGSGQAVVHHISQITPEHLAAHREAISEHLDKGAYQGGWHDTGDGNVYLDASHHFPDKHSALNFAGHQQQKAIFNLHDFSEHYMNPRQDPLAMKDHEAWKARYADTGTEPHPAFHEFAHRYPNTPEQDQHWSLHSKGAMTGRPVGAFRSERYVADQLRRRSG